MFYFYRCVNTFFFGKTKITIFKANVNSSLFRKVPKITFKRNICNISESKLKTMKFPDNPLFMSCITPEVQILRRLFDENGYEIRIVGGAVRDLLLGNKPSDLDFATTATPEEMKKMFLKNSIRLINNNGEKHGTITARINERNFEVTTLRVDVVTDGRRAEVSYTKNWVLDANRRDLTVNAMYLDFNGNLYDYFNGYEDLKNGQLNFVGDATLRIQEDYLRILRYFRFYGKIAKEPDSHCPYILKCIKENASGLSKISGERIWIELSKITSGKFTYEIFLKMIQLDVGSYIGIPQNCNLIEFKKVADNLKRHELNVKPITVIASLFDNLLDLEKFFSKIRPSTFDKNLGHFILLHRDELQCIKSCQKYILKENNLQQAVTYSCELLKYKGELEILKELQNWKAPKFPVNGNDLRNKGIQGRKVGIILEQLKDIWIDNDYDLENEQLLEYLPHIVANLSPAENDKSNVKKIKR